jgi:hypothetical protein
VKKNFSIIIFLISAVVLIAHDAIPHNHLDIDEYESVVSHIFKHSRHDHTQKENDHKHPAPRHQHVFAPDDLITRRTNVSVQKEIKLSFTSVVCFFTVSFISNANLRSNHSFTVIDFIPDSYPFIISPNSMRGSPAIA